jgi:orotate phosphoribosyltransferase
MRLRVTLIEDLITTGGAVRQAALSLRAQGAEVTSVVCAIDRSDGLPSALNVVDLAVHSVLTRTDLDAVHQQD